MTASVKKRLAIILAALVAVGVGVYILLNAFSENIVFYYSPLQVQNHEAPVGKTFRMGGMVKEGSIVRMDDDVTVRFGITDTAATITAQFKGILPDLFKEGTGVVADGKLDENGIFVCSSVLAKHDENYMPPEAKDAMDKAKQAMATVDAKGAVEGRDMARAQR